MQARSPTVQKKLPPVQTQRLILRPFALADWPAVHRYMSDPDVTRWLPEGCLDQAQTKAFVRKNIGRSATAVAAIARHSGELIGHMVFHPWFVHATQEIGWVIARQHQGRGYATEGARALLHAAFCRLGCHRVIATCQPENAASWRVMERLGLRREAHFRQALFRQPGVWWDEYFYALLADEYAPLHSTERD